MSLTTYLVCKIRKHTNAKTLRGIVTGEGTDAGHCLEHSFSILRWYNPTVGPFPPWLSLPTWVSVFLSLRHQVNKQFKVSVKMAGERKASGGLKLVISNYLGIQDKSAGRILVGISLVILKS